MSLFKHYLGAIKDDWKDANKIANKHTFLNYPMKAFLGILLSLKAAISVIGLGYFSPYWQDAKDRQLRKEGAISNDFRTQLKSLREQLRKDRENVESGIKSPPNGMTKKEYIKELNTEISNLWNATHDLKHSKDRNRINEIYDTYKAQVDAREKEAIMKIETSKSNETLPERWKERKPGRILGKGLSGDGITPTIARVISNKEVNAPNKVREN